MADEDEFEPVEEEEEEEEDLPFWESAAHSKIRGILDTIEYNVDEGTVTVRSDEWDPRGKGDPSSRTLSSLDELRQELVELGDSEMTSNVPGRMAQFSARIPTTWSMTLWTKLTP